MPPRRTGSVERFRRANGSVYFRARIRLADGTRQRVDVLEKYSTPAGGKSAEERADLYAAALQEREDETDELLALKNKRIAARKKADAGAETADKYFARLSKLRQADGVRDCRKERTIWNKWM